MKVEKRDVLRYSSRSNNWTGLKVMGAAQLFSQVRQNNRGVRQLFFQVRQKIRGVHQ